MTKPTFSLPVVQYVRTTKRLLDDEVNRYGGLIWSGSIAAASDPELAQQVADDVAASASAAQQSADDAALYDGPWYDNVTALLASTDTYTAGTIVRTREEGTAVEVATEGATDHHFTNSADTPVKFYYRGGPFFQNITLRVPSMYSTLRAAFDAATKLRPADGAQLTILIESGHSPSSGIMGGTGTSRTPISGGDWSWIKIESQDAVVTLASTFAGDVMRFENAALPQLHCLFDMGDAQAVDNGRHGVHLDRASRFYCASGAGVRNATEIGLWCRRNGQVTAQGSVWKGAGINCVRATHGSSIDIRGADCSDLLGSGPTTEATYNRSAIGIDKAFVDAGPCDISGSNGRGIEALANSYVNWGGDASNISDGPVINMDFGSRCVVGGTSNFDNFGGVDFGMVFQARNGGEIIGGDDISVLSCAGTLARAADGGRIDLPKVVCTTTGSGGSLIDLLESSGNYSRATLTTDHRPFEVASGNLNLVGATITAVTASSLPSGKVNTGARCQLDNASMTESVAGLIWAAKGAHVSAEGATLQKGSGASGTEEINCTAGSIVAAHNVTVTGGGAITDANVSLTALNTLEANGIVFG